MDPGNGLKLATAAAAVALLTGCADHGPNSTTASGEPRSCFLARNVSSWAPAGDTVVNLRVNVRDYYQLTLLGPCRNIDWNQRIGIEHRGSSWICSGLDATIIAPGPGGPDRCPATAVRRLTPEEVAALPPRERP